MIIKWTRESLLVLLTLLMILVAVFYYGDRLLVDPVRVEAELSSQTVSEQSQLLDQYPPSEETASDVSRLYEETVLFIPEDETINEALLIINTAADRSDVTLNQISRLADDQGVDELDARYAKSTYQIEFESAEASNMRDMLINLNEQNRLWNSRTLTYQQDGSEGIFGNFILELYYQSTNDN